jgi:phage/plasmid primase-like uncharacterized protein
VATKIDHIEQFRAFIKRLCDTDVPNIVADGKWHRFRIGDTRHKGSKPGAYLLHTENGRPNGIFIDWRDEQVRHKWFADGPVEHVDRAEIDRKRKERQQEIYRGLAEASAHALQFWKVCAHKPESLHPYLVEKRIGFNGARIGNHPAFGLGPSPLLIIPIRNIDPKLSTLQAIRADGQRRFFNKTTHEGGYVIIGDVKAPGPIALAEGFATGVTIHDATGWAVIVCVTAGNMERIARWASHQHAGRDFIVCGDDDTHLEDKPSGNVGRIKARHAALILGAKLAFPDLQGADGSDFNDQAAHYGIEDVAMTLANVRDGLAYEAGPQPEPTPEYLTDPMAEGEPAHDKLGFRIKDWSMSRFTGKAPPVEWLVEGVIPKGVPGMIASLGGLGKSYKAIELGLEIAIEVAGRPSGRKVLGGAVAQHGSVVILNAEDSHASIHRRLERLDPSGEARRLGEGHIYIVPLPAAGGPMPLINGGMPPTRTAAFEALMAQLDEIDDLALVIADPLQAFITADVTSDPSAAQFMWTSFAALCARKNATFIFTHHMRKDGSSNIKTAEDAREAIRGVTTLVDGSRFAYCIWTAGDEDARTICSVAGVEYAPRKVAFGAVVKANDEHDNSIHTYIRGPSGLLQDASEFAKAAKKNSATGLSPMQVGGALTEVHRRWLDKNPFSGAAQSGGRYLGRWLTDQFGLPKKTANDLVDTWISREILIEDTYDTKAKSKGLCVEKWPEDALEALAEVRKATSAIVS